DAVGGIARAGERLEVQHIPKRAREDVVALDLVQADNVARRLVGPPVRAGLRQAEGNDAAGGGTGEHVEQVGDRAVGTFFDRHQDQRGDDAANPAPVDGEYLEWRCHDESLYRG